MGLFMGQPQINGKKIKGTLAYAGVSLNNRLYLPEELQKGDGMTVPLILNHASTSGAEGELDRLPQRFRQGLENGEEMKVGEVTLSWDSDNLTLFYEGTVEDEFFQHEIDDANMAVSLGMYYDSDSPQVCDVECYTMIKGAEFHEVSLVYHPGFPIATIEANEVALKSKSLESISFTQYPRIADNSANDWSRADTSDNYHDRRAGQLNHVWKMFVNKFRPHGQGDADERIFSMWINFAQDDGISYEEAEEKWKYEIGFLPNQSYLNISPDKKETNRQARGARWGEGYTLGDGELETTFDRLSHLPDKILLMGTHQKELPSECKTCGQKFTGRNIQEQELEHVKETGHTTFVSSLGESTQYELVDNEWVPLGRKTPKSKRPSEYKDFYPVQKDYGESDGRYQYKGGHWYFQRDQEPEDSFPINQTIQCPHCNQTIGSSDNITRTYTNVKDGKLDKSIYDHLETHKGESYAQESPMYYFNDEQIDTISDLLEDDLLRERSKLNKDYSKIGHLRVLQRYAKNPSKKFKRVREAKDGEGLELMGTEIPIELFQMVYDSVEPTLKMKLEDIVNQATNKLTKESSILDGIHFSTEVTQGDWESMSDSEKRQILMENGFHQFIDHNSSQSWDNLHPMIQWKLKTSTNRQATLFEAEYAGPASWWDSLSDDEKLAELEKYDVDATNLFTLVGNYSTWNEIPNSIKDYLSSKFLSPPK